MQLLKPCRLGTFNLMVEVLKEDAGLLMERTLEETHFLQVYLHHYSFCFSVSNLLFKPFFDAYTGWFTARGQSWTGLLLSSRDIIRVVQDLTLAVSVMRHLPRPSLARAEKSTRSHAPYYNIILYSSPSYKRVVDILVQTPQLRTIVAQYGEKADLPT